ncbi:MAG: peptidylprolyl isomerase [Candidatus Delongbacteria bacterium]|nr:peptidylprolyl isomerase [Candidatus Delongbacteria bacterium]
MKLIKSSVLFMLFFCGVNLQAEVIDRIIAVVGDDIILKSEVEQYAAQKKIFGFEGSEQELRENILEELISSKILYDIAKKDSTISVSDEEVQRILDSRINPILQQVGGEKKFEEMYNTTIADLKRLYRTEIRKNTLVEKLKNNFYGSVTVSRREVEEYYNNFKDSIPPVKPSVSLSQLVIGFSNEALSQSGAVKIVNEIRDQIIEGTVSFEKAAEIYSSDESSKLNGGSIGFTSRGDLVPEYERAAYNLEAGQISAPVKTEYGYHLIRVDEKIGEKISTSHILITPEAYVQDDSSTYEFAVSIRDSVMNRQMTFEEAVRKYSSDEKSRIYNGQIGALNLEDLDKKYTDIFESADIGYITEPIKEKDGYYLYKIMDRKDGHEIDINSDYTIIKNLAADHKRQYELKKWIDELRKKVYIDIKL